MIKLIAGLPDNVIGVEISGTVSAQDYETVIIPAIEAAVAENRKLRLLYHVNEDFEKYDMAAAWEDAKVGLQHLTAWHKVAVVTDVDWIRSSVKVFGFAMPGHVRAFDNAQLAEAKDWVTG